MRRNLLKFFGGLVGWCLVERGPVSRRCESGGDARSLCRGRWADLSGLISPSALPFAGEGGRRNQAHNNQIGNMKRLTKHTRGIVGATLTIKWGTSRGRDSYGYTTCSLYENGRKIAACNGGGYDMRGTVIGDWMTNRLTPALLRLKPEQMPEHSHWEGERARICVGDCREQFRDLKMRMLVAETGAEVFQPKLPDDCWECPRCKGSTNASRDGKRAQDGRYFYGLTFHDPNYDASKARIGKDCSDRTLAKDGSEGLTVAEAEAAGVSFGLERLQATYEASSKTPTRRHRIPSIDGACGLSSVESILAALGLRLERLDRGSRRGSGPELYKVSRC